LHETLRVMCAFAQKRRPITCLIWNGENIISPPTNSLWKFMRDSDRELFHPARITQTGTHSSLVVDKLILLIEDDAVLGVGIPSARERVEEFAGVRAP